MTKAQKVAAIEAITKVQESLVGLIDAWWDNDFDECDEILKDYPFGDLELTEMTTDVSVWLGEIKGATTTEQPDEQ